MLQKLKQFFTTTHKNLPTIFGKHFVSIFLIGAVLVLAWAVYIFYREAYLVVKDEYEVLAIDRRVNQEVFDRAINHIEEQSRLRAIPTRNPFFK